MCGALPIDDNENSYEISGTHHMKMNFILINSIRRIVKSFVAY